jgi:hypothetical protein
MTKIRLQITVDCDDESTATRVQEEYFPKLNDLLASSGVFGVSAVWLAERESD